MSAFNNHDRHPTWPPTLQLLPDCFNDDEESPKAKPHSQRDQTSDIDEDPFSHFLSPVLEDEDPCDETSYTAGITSCVSESEIKTARFRARLEERWENYMAHRLLSHQILASTASSLPILLSATPPDEDQLPDLYVDDIDASTPDTESSSPPYFPSMSFDDDADGWEADRLHGNSVQVTRLPLKRPRFRSSRTLSGKKHSWREPSDQLFTLTEEDEDEVMEDRGRKGRKKSKTVRWSENVQVVEYER